MYDKQEQTITSNSIVDKNLPRYTEENMATQYAWNTEKNILHKKQQHH